MRIMLTGGVWLLAALLLSAGTAAGGVVWCKADPIVRIDGLDVQLWVAIPESYVPYVNGPIKMHIRTPRWVQERRVLMTDTGFNGYGERVRWGYFTEAKRTSIKTTEAGANLATIPIEVTVTVPFDQPRLRAAFGYQPEVPLQLEVIQAHGRDVLTGTLQQATFEIMLVISSAGARS